MKKFILLMVMVLMVVSCGKDECPQNGQINTTRQDCPNYQPYYSYNNNNQYCTPCSPQQQGCYYTNGQYCYNNGQNQYPQSCQYGTCQQGQPNCYNGCYYPR